MFPVGIFANGFSDQVEPQFFSIESGSPRRIAFAILSRMAAGQLWLFPPPKPLVERFGHEFFHQLPEQPGAYLMCGEREGVLYVGSAKNLKKRLSAYRVSNPERFPRRIIRLLNEVRRIEFDICASEAIARHREEELICAMLPKFNRAGKVWPKRSGASEERRTYISQKNGGALPTRR